jgi:hypothetical protein
MLRIFNKGIIGSKKGTLNFSIKGSEKTANALHYSYG